MPENEINCVIEGIVFDIIGFMFKKVKGPLYHFLNNEIETLEIQIENKSLKDFQIINNFAHIYNVILKSSYANFACQCHSPYFQEQTESFGKLIFTVHHKERF